MRAVGFTCGIGSMLLGARNAGFDIVGNIEWRKYYSKPDAAGRSTFKENFRKAFMVEKSSDLADDLVRSITGIELALGHPESHPDLPVFTNHGWKRVRDIQVGNFVLTHMGRFRQVAAVHRSKPTEDTDRITICVPEPIVLAGNHPLRMRDGSWKKAVDIRISDQIMFLTDDGNDGFKPAQVMSLSHDKFDPNEPLYDLSVDEDHSYVADGFVVHNCGNFSNLNANRAAVTDPGDIPLYVDMVARFKPRFFVMDDLPKSFIAYSMQAYAERLPDYDLYPEWISNWGYGNVQKQRNRMFMIGALKGEGYAFVPGEAAHKKTVADIIGDLWEGENPQPGRNYPPNHDVHTLTENCAKGLHLKHQGHRATWGEMRDYVLNELKEGGPITYIGPEGKEMTRVGSYKGHWHGNAHVLTGGISGFHPLRGVPYTIRERARLQGFPDDFVFYGTELDAQGRWNHDRNMHMVRQTGKAMPVQFCEFVSAQVKAHIEGRDLAPTRTRVLQPNEYISQAKSWYCANVGYADQAKACASCWLYDRCSIRSKKYQIGRAAAPAPEAAVGGRLNAERQTIPAHSEAPTADVLSPSAPNPRGAARGRSRIRRSADPVIAGGTSGPDVKPSREKPRADYSNVTFEEDFGNV